DVEVALCLPGLEAFELLLGQFLGELILAERLKRPFRNRSLSLGHGNDPAAGKYDQEPVAHFDMHPAHDQVVHGILNQNAAAFAGLRRFIGHDEAKIFRLCLRRKILAACVRSSRTSPGGKKQNSNGSMPEVDHFPEASRMVDPREMIL